ncbi:hypothetical protein GCM10027592_36410 [Spirosoma flavus]
MSNHGSSYLIEQLLNNKLSRAELDEFLAGLHNESSLQTYSDALETHFNELLNQYSPPSEKNNDECKLNEDKPEDLY